MEWDVGYIYNKRKRRMSIDKGERRKGICSIHSTARHEKSVYKEHIHSRSTRLNPLALSPSRCSANFKLLGLHPLLPIPA